MVGPFSTDAYYEHWFCWKQSVICRLVIMLSMKRLSGVHSNLFSPPSKGSVSWAVLVPRCLSSRSYASLSDSTKILVNGATLLCLSVLPFKSERSVKKLIGGFQFYRDKLHERRVYEKFTEILAKVCLSFRLTSISSSDKYFFPTGTF